MIKSRFSSVDTTTISWLKKQLPAGATRPSSKRLPLVSEQTQRYITTRLLCHGKLDGSRVVREEYLRPIGIEMTVYGIRKMLKRIW